MKTKPVPPATTLLYAMRRAMILARQVKDQTEHRTSMSFDEDDSEWECVVRLKKEAGRDG